MPDGSLPPLDPDGAGSAAFYNVISQAGLTQSSLTWSDVVNNGSVSAYDTYNNGVVLEYGNGLTVRCKTDGWVVAYDGWTGGANGRYDSLFSLIDGRASDETPSTVTDNRLANAIYDVITDLSDWNLAEEFNYSDVGLYSFTTTADAISQFVEEVSVGNGEGGSDNATRVVEQLPGTQVYAAHAGGFVHGNRAKLFVEGEQVASETNGGGTYGAVLDVATSLATDGTVEVRGKCTDGYSSAKVFPTAMFAWSEA